MKIRFYQSLDGYRWIGFFIAMISVFILSAGNPETQYIGWLLSVISCTLWVYIGYRDRDIARSLMEMMYLALSVRAVINWL